MSDLLPYIKNIARILCIDLVVIHEVLLISVRMRRVITEIRVTFNVGQTIIQGKYVQSPVFYSG